VLGGVPPLLQIKLNSERFGGRKMAEENLLRQCFTISFVIIGIGFILLIDIGTRRDCWQIILL
jgi:hypothetical protein